MTAESRGFCRFCIALCGIRVTTDGPTVVSVQGDPDHPGSRGYTCAKGRALGRWHHHPRRIVAPRIRDGSAWRDASWDAAFDGVVGAIQSSIGRFGADSVGVYFGTAASFDAAGKWVGERFVRALGTRSKYSAFSIDTPCKPIVSLLMSGHPGLVPVVDDRRCTLTVFVGCNPVVSHGHVNGFPNPVVRLRTLAEAPRELWVVDSRTTETSRLATRSLTVRPGTDFAIPAYLVRELLLAGGADHGYLAAHADEREVRELADVLAEWTVERASDVTGCAPGDLQALLAAVRRHGRVAMQTGTGATMSGVANLTEWLVWVLHVVTGSFDAPGGMWFHPGFLRQMHRNARPSVGTPGPQPGPPSRPELAVWGDEYPCAAMVDEIESGRLRVLVVVGGNPMSAFPDTTRTGRALRSLDALVVLDVVDTETTTLATHVLPVTGQLERADIPYFYDLFSLDCSTQFSPAFVPPLGEARSTWRVVSEVAARLGVDVLPPHLTTESSDVDVLGVLADGAAAPFEQIRREQYVAGEPVFGWVRDRVLPEHRWRLAPRELVDHLADWRSLVPPAGLLATARRQHRQLNSQHPTGGATRAAEDAAVLHPDAAAARGFAEGDAVVVSSSHGTLVIRAVLSADQHPDVVSLPHGWVGANVSALTSGRDADALSGMVLQTALPVEVRRAAPPK